MSINRSLIPIARHLIDRFPRIANVFRTARDQLDFLEEPIVTPWGFKLAGNTSMAQGTFEHIETELVRSILNNVDVFVNVGANVGYYCCHALSMGIKVIAFEPIQRNLRYLCKNIKANGWFGAGVYPIALHNSVGITEMYGGNTGASLIKGWAGVPESYVALVPSSTMDVVLGKRLKGKRCLILVDVEGAEYLVLLGAMSMLTNEPKPIWLVEITTTEHQPDGIQMNPNFKNTFQLFFQRGYQAFSVGHKMHPITMEDVSLIMKGNLEPETHNFLFCESQERCCISIINS